jgi:hypothetical protein
MKKNPRSLPGTGAEVRRRFPQLGGPHPSAIRRRRSSGSTTPDTTIDATTPSEPGAGFEESGAADVLRPTMSTEA